MPEGPCIADIRDDPYAWARAQPALLRQGAICLKTLDAPGLGESPASLNDLVDPNLELGEFVAKMPGD